MTRAFAVAAAAAAIVVPTAHADDVPASYLPILAAMSIDIGAPDPSYVPGVDAYDAQWLARLHHGQVYLVRYHRYWEPVRTAWMIVLPHFLVVNTGPGRGPAAWCGIAFSFLDADHGGWLGLSAVGQVPIPRGAPIPSC